MCSVFALRTRLKHMFSSELHRAFDKRTQRIMLRQAALGKVRVEALVNARDVNVSRTPHRSETPSMKDLWNV